MTTDEKIKKAINHLIDLKNSPTPFSSKLEWMKDACDNAEIGRQGAYSLIIGTLKCRLLDDLSFDCEKYEMEELTQDK